MSLITDMNAAFHGNKNHVDKLEKEFQAIVGNNILEDSLKLAAPDPNWQEKLNKYRR
jgi:hypothetical protein